MLTIASLPSALSFGRLHSAGARAALGGLLALLALGCSPESGTAPGMAKAQTAAKLPVDQEAIVVEGRLVRKNGTPIPGSAFELLAQFDGMDDAKPPIQQLTSDSQGGFRAHFERAIGAIQKPIRFTVRPNDRSLTGGSVTLDGPLGPGPIALGDLTVQFGG